MEEIEVPIEGLQEEIHHHAEHEGHGEGGKGNWNSLVALSTAILAVLAAISALLAGHHANEAMIEQMQASDKWAYYQAKGIKSAVLSSKIELLGSLNHPVAEADTAKVAQYKDDQEKTFEEATEKEKSSSEHLERHNILARSVTMFQVGVAIAAISVLMRKKPLWYVSLACGGVGVYFLVAGVI